MKSLLIACFIILGASLIFAPAIFATEPLPKVPQGAGEFEIPCFIPPESTAATPPEAAAIPFIARIRERVGSPLESAAWQPVPGSSPLKVDSHRIAQATGNGPATAAGSDSGPVQGVVSGNDIPATSAPSASSWPELARQIRKLAVEMERSAADCEDGAQYERADEMRKMAGQLWKQARVLQGWSESP